MSSPFNIFACLVHESFECVIDLVQNLRYFDPDSLIMLYNGGEDPSILPRTFPFERYNAVVYPSLKPMKWGRLHEFAFDCIQFAKEVYHADS